MSYYNTKSKNGSSVLMEGNTADKIIRRRAASPDGGSNEIANSMADRKLGVEEYQMRATSKTNIRMNISNPAPGVKNSFKEALDYAAGKQDTGSSKGL